MSFDKQTPVIRDIREFDGLERTLALAYLNAPMKIQFIVDEFLQDDPRAQMYLAWLENTVMNAIKQGVDITLNIKMLYDAYSIVDLGLYTKKELV